MNSAGLKSCTSVRSRTPNETRPPLLCQGILNSTPHDFSSGHSAAIDTIGIGRRQRATTPPKHSASVTFSMTPKGELKLLEELEMLEELELLEVQRLKELRHLEDIFSTSFWLLNDLIEPVIGDAGCHPLAAKYGITRESCYTAFVQDNEDRTYGCRFQQCHNFRVRSLEDVIRHQRYYHFGHRPFECTILPQW
jgi:hypothetical protein